MYERRYSSIWNIDAKTCMDYITSLNLSRGISVVAPLPRLRSLDIRFLDPTIITSRQTNALLRNSASTLTHLNCYQSTISAIFERGGQYKISLDALTSLELDVDYYRGDDRIIQDINCVKTNFPSLTYLNFRDHNWSRWNVFFEHVLQDSTFVGLPNLRNIKFTNTDYKHQLKYMNGHDDFISNGITGELVRHGSKITHMPMTGRIRLDLTEMCLHESFRRKWDLSKSADITLWKMHMVQWQKQLAVLLAAKEDQPKQPCELDNDENVVENEDETTVDKHNDDDNDI